VEPPKAHQLPLHEPKISEDLLEIPGDETKSSDVVPPPRVESDVLDIKNMSVDDIKNLLQHLSTSQQEDKPPTPPPKKSHTSALSQKKLLAHLLNCYQTLAVEEAPNLASDASTTAEATCAKQPRRPRWERRLLLVPEIGATELRRNSLYLRVEVESTENQRKYGIHALVDSGATGLFIDREYVKSNQIPTRRLSNPIPVRNVDGTANMAGTILEVAELILQYNGHSERALFCVTGLGSQNLILGHTWLQDHNPEVDWKMGKVEMS
jgi:predicted aspartyl protease